MKSYQSEKYCRNIKLNNLVTEEWTQRCLSFTYNKQQKAMGDHVIEVSRKLETISDLE